jgi:hypothetical protein
MPHPLTPEEQNERRSDPTPLTRFFFQHAWLAGAASGGVIGAWVSLGGGTWPIAVGLGFGMFLWSPPPCSLQPQRTHTTTTRQRHEHPRSKENRTLGHQTPLRRRTRSTQSITK